MNDFSLRIEKTSDEYSPWILSSKMVEMAYNSLKNSYSKGSPRRLEFKILKERLKKQLDEQDYKIYTMDSVYLNFSPYDDKEIEWFINCFESYLSENNLKSVVMYSKLLNELKKQL